MFGLMHLIEIRENVYGMNGERILAGFELFASYSESLARMAELRAKGYYVKRWSIMPNWSYPVAVAA